MTRVVEAVAAEYSEKLHWEKVVTGDLAGARRYAEFSKSLGRLAPIPCIVIEGELAFESTPSIEALKASLDQYFETL